MAADYIPTTDADFQVWLDNFSALITAAPTDYGLTTGDATALATLTTTYDDALLAANNGSTRGPATVIAKDTARVNAEGRSRQLATQIQANPSISNELKTNLRLTIRKTTKTPVPAPVTAPLINFISASALRHTLRYSDETTPDSRKRPFGSSSLVLSWWITPIGTTPSGPPNFTQPFSRIPILIDFSSADVNKTVTYSGKWVTATGLMGPISNSVNATVIGAASGG